LVNGLIGRVHGLCAQPEFRRPADQPIRWT
jgi:hypothetical protein